MRDRCGSTVARTYASWLMSLLMRNRHAEGISALVHCRAGSFAGDHPLSSVIPVRVPLLSVGLAHPVGSLRCKSKCLLTNSYVHEDQNTVWCVQVRLVSCAVRCQDVVQLLTSLPNHNPLSLLLRQQSLPVLSFRYQSSLHCYEQDDQLLAITPKIDSYRQQVNTERCLRIHLFSRILTTNRDFPIT